MKPVKMDKATIVSRLRHLILNPPYDMYDMQQRLMDLMLEIHVGMPDKPQITTCDFPAIPTMKLIREFLHGKDAMGKPRLPQYVETDPNGVTAGHMPLRDVKDLTYQLLEFLVKEYNAKMDKE